MKSQPEPEVVLAAILDSKSAICRISVRRRWRNVGIAVPRERASTEDQYGVPAPGPTGSRINSPEVVTMMRETARGAELRAAGGET